MGIAVACSAVYSTMGAWKEQCLHLVLLCCGMLSLVVALVPMELMQEDHPTLELRSSRTSITCTA